MGNETGKLFFRIAVSITLLGLLLYFVQEIIVWFRQLPIIMPANGVPATILISNIAMMIAIILVIILLFTGFKNTKITRITIIIGAVYLLGFTIAHAFIPFFNTGNWAIPIFFGKNIVAFYSYYDISFINLLLLGIIAIFVIGKSITKMNQEKITITEKFTYIVVLSLLFIFNLSTISTLKGFLLGVYSVLQYYGFFMLPYIIETILIAFAIILFAISIGNKENKTVKILGIILLNIFFISMISTTVTDSILNFTIGAEYIPLVTGNYLIIIGTVLTSIASIITIKNKIQEK
ncbi:MAG: hypothetical protein GNW80_09810 [Asgard group archaeon]|nr:hypothetical protein [Asgard group archaeon]